MLDKETLWAEIYMNKQLREAEHQRLVREIEEEQGLNKPAARLVLAWLGRRLVVWGNQLVKRYEQTDQTLLLVDKSTCER